MKAHSNLTYFQALPGVNSVDQEQGVIRGVSVLTIGPALGHGIYIDQEGLNQCLTACNARGSVRLIDKHDAEFEGIVGAVTNFRIEGDQVKGDVELFKEHPMRGRILEIATKIPTEFGLSIEASDEHVDNPAGDGKLFRTSDVDAIALVPRPAANRRGMFSAQVDTSAKAKRRKTNFSKPMSKLKTALKSFAKFAQLEEGDELDNVIDAIVDAVQKDPQPSIEDRLKKLEDSISATDDTSMSSRLKKLEDASSDEPSDEEKKEQETQMRKLASDIAEEKITKFTAEIGLQKAPGSSAGFTVRNDAATKFESEISTQIAAGAKDRGTAILRLAKAKPEIYNEAAKAGLV